MPSWGRHELPTIGAICLHVAVPLPSVSSAGSGGEASWQSNKPLLFTQMAGEMAHPMPGNTVPQLWDQHELCSSVSWMTGKKGYALQLHSPHRLSSDCECENVWLCHVIFFFSACPLASSVDAPRTVCFWSGTLEWSTLWYQSGLFYTFRALSVSLCVFNLSSSSSVLSL